MEEWENAKYTCDSCGEDGVGVKFYNIVIRGWKPLCLCKECIEDMEVENE